MAPVRLKIACAGLGRMGKRHALHLLKRVPRAELVAVASPNEEELRWAQQHLEPWGVALYKSYEQMLKHEGLQAVIIASITTVHAEQAIKAIQAEKHVLCEKPLSTSVKTSQTVVDAAKQKPDLKVMCGFSRRFDDSYRDAWRKVQAGKIGRPSIFRSQTCDKLDSTGFFVKFAEQSGGIFVDCAIHDIDLALWFFGKDSRIKAVVGSGIAAVHRDLCKLGDRDNAIGIIEFHEDRIAYLYCSRMMAAGQEDATEIIGPKGKVTVNMHPQINLVNIYEPSGIRREIPQTYYDRYETAFVTEADEFTAACLDDLKLPMDLSEAVKAVEIACALQESLVTGRKIRFDETGRRIDKATL
ncbi:MAG: hypothetical protein Q9163_004279 [Psora crenata]